MASIKTIIFGFSRPIAWKPFAEAIMAYDKSNFDHGYVKFKSVNWGCDFIYQSSGMRTNFMGGTYFESINTIVEEYSLDVTEESEAKVGSLCVRREGMPYPIKMVCGEILVKVVSAITFKKINMKNPWPTDLTDCIAEQAAILSEEFKFYCPLDFNNATPLEFRNWIQTIPNIKRTK